MFIFKKKNDKNILKYLLKLIFKKKNKINKKTFNKQTFNKKI